VGLAARNVYFETTYRLAEVSDCRQSRKLADEAWKTHQGGHPTSKEYEKGFKAGFSEFIFDGRTYRPAPPPYLLTRQHKAAASQAALEDWIHGYEDGVAAAQQSGLRRLVVVPPDALARPPFPAPLPSATLGDWWEPPVVLGPPVPLVGPLGDQPIPPAQPHSEAAGPVELHTPRKLDWTPAAPQKGS
jgi:hypothetical protein